MEPLAYVIHSLSSIIALVYKKIKNISSKMSSTSLFYFSFSDFYPILGQKDASTESIYIYIYLTKNGIYIFYIFILIEHVICYIYVCNLYYIFYNISNLTNIFLF